MVSLPSTSYQDLRVRAAVDESRWVCAGLSSRRRRRRGIRSLVGRVSLRPSSFEGGALSGSGGLIAMSPRRKSMDPNAGKTYVCSVAASGGHSGSQGSQDTPKPKQGASLLLKLV